MTRPILDAARASAAAEIFADALEAPPEQRAALLERTCAADADLRAEVESLLAAHATMGDAFRAPPRVGGLADAPDPNLGRVLGPYRLVSLIDSGGMGSVYLGDRADHEFEKRVAIKLVRAGLGTPDLLERLRRERQVLAGLEHPYIARLLDGGSTPEGVPYLVMEFVDGVPIDRFADQRRLPVEQRLALFLEVCEAVQYAHRHLVIHRDLKPGNILVDDAGRPKLLDFGIAKVLETANAGDDPGSAVTAMRALTPRYASPEQIRGGRVTTATDVYGLGVLLFELLCGAPPHQLAGLGPSEAERLICDTAAPRPSALARDHAEAAEVAARRGTTPARLARRLSGDLDTILLKAVSKEPERRYTSVEEFADDLRRHRIGEPVRARPDSAGYRAGKFVRRHRAGVAVAAGVAVLLIAFATSMAVQARRVAAERDRANAAAAEARAVSTFQQEMLTAADPGQPDAMGRTVTVEQALDRAAKQLDEGSLAGQPNVEAAVRHALGTSYLGLGLYPSAEPHFERAIALRRAAGDPVALADATDDLATLRRAQGRIAEADSLFTMTLELRRNAKDVPRENLARALNNLGVIRYERGAHAEAESLYREARAIYAVSPTADIQEVAGNLTSLAIAVSDDGRLAEAEPLLREAVERYRRALGPEHPDVARALAGLGQLLRRKGDIAGADSAYQAMVAIRRKALGPDHPDYATGLNNLSTVRRDRGEYASAEMLLREALGIWRRSVGDSHPNVATGLGNLATLIAYQRRFVEAESLSREALAIRRRALGAEHTDVALSLYQLGVLLLDAGDPARAAPPLRESLAMRRRVLRPGHADVGESMAALGRMHLDSGRATEAEPILRESVAVQESGGSTNWRVQEARSLMGAALAALGSRAAGESLMVAAADSLDRMASAPLVRRTQARERLAASQTRL